MQFDDTCTISYFDQWKNKVWVPPPPPHPPPHTHTHTHLRIPLLLSTQTKDTLTSNCLFSTNTNTILHGGPRVLHNKNPCYKDKMKSRLRLLWHGSLYTWKEFSFYWIITLVQQKKNRFDTKMPGLTQNAWLDTKKCPVRHKNAQFDTKSPASMHQLTLPLSTPTPPLVGKIFLSNFIQGFFKNPYRNENEIILISIQIYLISIWNLKCHYYSFLFVMTIMSAAINKCHWYGRIILPISAFSFDCSIKKKADTHLAQCRFNNALNKNFSNYSQ